MNHPHRAEDVHIVDVLEAAGSNVLGGNESTGDACVVDQNVQPACLSLDPLCGGCHRRVRGDIEFNKVCANGFGRDRSSRGVPGTKIDSVSSRHELSRSFKTEALVGAGD